MKEKIQYLFRAAVHPFDAFYDIRFRGKGSVFLAGVILFLYGVLACVSYQYKGFIMNENPVDKMNSISIFFSSVFIILLFCTANWSVTTLFDGKGTMASIFEVICYSLLPYILIELICIFLSNYIIQGEVMLVYMLHASGIVWSVFLVFTGLCTVHEYGLGRNLVSLLITAAAAVIIIFLIILFLSLEEKMFGFLGALLSEGFRRFYY